MEKLSHESLQNLRAVEDSLAHYSIEGDNVQASLDALQALLATDKLFLYSLAQRPGGDDLTVSREASVGSAHERWRELFDDFLRGRGVSWAGYNAVKPEPAQRDRVLGRDEIATLTEGRSLAIEEALGSRLGILGEDRARVLVCEGSSMLAWLGFVQPEKTTERQRGLLARVVPAFRKRLRFERFVTEAALASSAMPAALEELNGAAWVLGTDGRVAHANAAGRAKVDEDAPTTRGALAAAVAGVADPRFKVTPLRGSHGRVGHIVVELPDRETATQGVSRAARRFGLTPAQTRVLERVARGVSNAAIAADLGIAERTVEAHVTAILVKAQVPSRAALIVQIFAERQSA